MLTVYSASAGSGKTYTLTREYLRLALSSSTADGFRTILALTFTNDAAGEMKLRITERLRELRTVLPDPAHAAEQFAADLVGALTADGALAATADYAVRRAEVARRAGAMFRQLLYDYADFAVGTIDSFSQRIASTFGRDLGLPAGFEVEMDSAGIMAEAVGRLLDRVNRPPDGGTDPTANHALTALLTAFVAQQTADGKYVGTLDENLTTFGRQLFNDNYLDHLRELTAPGRDLAFYGQLATAYEQRREAVALHFRETATHLRDLIADAGLAAEHFANGKTGIYAYLTDWERRLTSEGGPNTYVVNTINGGEWASAKGRPFRGAIEALVPTLTAAYTLIEKQRPEATEIYLLLAALQRHHLAVTLLGELQREVAALLAERGLVLIGEFGRLISRVVLGEPSAFVYERLGDRYAHLMIDEFQDTSALQFHNLLPLLADAVARAPEAAAGAPAPAPAPVLRALLVGDGKQAIYRFRGGEMDQLVALYARAPQSLLARVRHADARALLAPHYQTLDGRITDRNLEENYRSAAPIVAFNNALFRAARLHWGGEIEQLAALFGPLFEQRSPAHLAALPAHVELLLLPENGPARAYDARSGTLLEAPLPAHGPDEVLDYQTLMLWRVEALVQQALADGFALGDIGILSRRNKDSAAVARFLKERGYAIISRDSLQLDFADSVNLLVGVLRVLHRPTDALARAGALLCFDRVVRHVAPYPGRAAEISPIADRKAPDAAAFWAELARHGFGTVEPARLGALSLYETAEQLLTAFDLLARAATEADYLLRFLDLTLEFSLRHGNNLGAFLQYWDKHAHAQSINTPTEGRDAITITTIHKAKGLAYGVVIVPFADWRLEPGRDALLWSHLTPKTVAGLVPTMPPVAVVPLTKALAATALAADYADERARTFVEGLNMLYVALTRPRNRLYLLSKALKDDEKESEGLPKTTAELLRRLVPALAEATAGAEAAPDGRRYVLSRDAGAPPAKPRAVAAGFTLKPAPTTPWAPRLRLRQRALDTLSFDPDAQAARLTDRRNRLRAALRRLTCPADVEQLLRRLRAEGAANRAETADLRADLRAVLADPRLQPLFTHVLEPEPEVLRGGAAAPDPLPARVVEDKAGGRVTLLDFPADPADAAARAAFGAYAARFLALGFPEVRAWWYDVATGDVLDVALSAEPVSAPETPPQTPTFFDDLAAELLAVAPADVEAADNAADERPAVVLVPTRRAAVYLRASLRRAVPVGEVRRAPRVLPLEDYVAELAGVSCCTDDELALQLRLYDVLSAPEHLPNLTFDDFAGWGPLLLRDFSTLDQEAADARQVFSYLSQAKTLERWELTADAPLLGRLNGPDSAAGRYLRFWEQLEPVYHAFRAQLAAEHLAYPGMAYRAAVVAMQARLADDPDRVPAHWFVGLETLSESEKQLIKILRKAHKATVRFDTDRFYFPDSPSRAARPFRRAQEALGLSLSSFGPHGAPTDALQQRARRVRALAVANPSVQGRVAGQLIKEALEEHPHATIAVVLPDETLLLPVLYGLPECEFNVTMGLSFQATPLFSLIDQLFEVQLTATTAGAHPSYHHDAVNRLLGHPLLRHYERWLNDQPGQLPNIFAGLTHQITTRNYVQVPLDKLREWGQAHPLLEALFAPWATARDVVGALDELHAALRAAVAPAPAAMEGEYLLAFHRLVRQLGRAFEGRRQQPSVRAFRLFLNARLRALRLPFEGHPIAQVQVMGWLETRALDFDHVIVLSCNEGTLPAAKRHESLLPHDLLTEFQLPTYVEREADTAHQFWHLLTRARRVDLLYALPATEGVRIGERSRFLLQLEHDLVPRTNGQTTFCQQVVTVEPSETAAETTPETPALPDLLVITKTAEVLRALRTILGKQLSPSGLNAFLRCPMQFYYKRVLRLGEGDEIEEELGDTHLGNAVHKVLEWLMAPHAAGQQPVTPADVAAWQAPGYLDGFLTRAFAELARPAAGPADAASGPERLAAPDQGKNHLLRRAAAQQLEGYLAQLATEVAIEPLRVKAVETEFSGTVCVDLAADPALGIPAERLPVRLVGRVDRVDETADGGLRIVDYKTGNVKRSELNLRGQQKPKTVAEARVRLLTEASSAAEKVRQLWLYELMARARNHLDAATQSGPSAGATPVKAAIVSLRNLPEGYLSAPLDFLLETDAPDALKADEAAFREVIHHLLDPAEPIRRTENLEHCARCDFRRVCAR